jgi:benzoyl-CoA reductase/2-hydroxyglutaryl-CoA dehydratase subunit BcrC/BadD/HgdB
MNEAPETLIVDDYTGEPPSKRLLKIVTDYSPSDMGQIRTRVEALLETAPGAANRP